jgi:hypothetical protein
LIRRHVGHVFRADQFFDDCSHAHYSFTATGLFTGVQSPDGCDAFGATLHAVRIAMYAKHKIRFFMVFLNFFISVHGRSSRRQAAVMDYPDCA